MQVDPQQTTASMIRRCIALCLAAGAVADGPQLVVGDARAPDYDCKVPATGSSMPGGSVVYNNYACLGPVTYCLANKTMTCGAGTYCSSVFHTLNTKLNPCVTKPVRKDWDTLTTKERNKFLYAVNALKRSSGSYSENYDYFVKAHSDAYHMPSPWKGHDEASIHYRNGDQKGPAFLPWHRQQLNMFEAAIQLQLSDHTFALPYWNYMKDSARKDSVHAPLWSAADGIGGGEHSAHRAKEGNYTVTDGPFAHWPIKYADLGEKFLERDIGFNFAHPGVAEDFVTAFDQTVYDSPPYSADSKTGFRNFIEGFGKAAVSGESMPDSSDGAGDKPHGLAHLSTHAAAHAFVGRSMVNSTSPNDPAFFLLHAFTDALWASWQKKQLEQFPVTEERKNTTVFDHFDPHADGPTNHALHDKLAKLYLAGTHGWVAVTAADVLDYDRMAYTYDELPVPKTILANLKEESA